MVECDLAKVEVAGSNPVSRSNVFLPPILRNHFPHHFQSFLPHLGHITKPFRGKSPLTLPCHGTFGSVWHTEAQEEVQEIYIGTKWPQNTSRPEKRSAT